MCWREWVRAHLCVCVCVCVCARARARACWCGFVFRLTPENKGERKQKQQDRRHHIRGGQVDKDRRGKGDRDVDDINRVYARQVIKYICI